MYKKSLFFLLLLALAITLYFSPNFETIAAGVAILLFGMIMLEEGFKVFTKGPLQQILKKTTDKLYKSITTGAVLTTLIQSSSLVSVITISFISAGLISLSSGIGLIFGANIGSTTTAWLVAGFGLKIKISALAMPMLIFGLIFSLQKVNTLKGIGNVLIGLGFFFLGIFFMKEGFDVFSNDIDLTKYAVSGFLGLILYTGIGIIITVLLQSSAASLVLVLTALAAGQIEYENALALAIGANVGTTITAILGSISSNIAGKRLAIAHLIFNVITATLALAFIYPLGNLVNYLANAFGISATDYTLKLALFHTIFNVVGVLIMIPFIKKLEQFLVKYIEDKPNSDAARPHYLNEAVLAFPASVITALTDESKDLYKNAIFEIVAHGINIHREDIKSNEKPKNIIKNSTKDLDIAIDEVYHAKVKYIYGEIIRYAATAQSKLKLTESQNTTISEIKIANRKMVEIIKDVRELNRNVNMSSTLNNKYLIKEYNLYRKKVLKVLRVIYRFRKGDDTKNYSKKMNKLKTAAKQNKAKGNHSIDNLIRKELITPEMASSLFNDYSYVNDIIKKLIEVAELLYSNKDSLLENNPE
ncbi:Na/Pi cotransporter family protein [Aureibaculum sp. A20]|uniref:Na/Pi cotransporter family protein n=1 Tax=Aureibaculum flavum TaxID=2795986 RepID=A0ABS0WPV0_9FLAO|nr:Na/Pi symporter [Aureibaculum flavum]MBJ2173992.1 Na/Pi cotransporter family protein [Aureibaculum flavum]